MNDLLYWTESASLKTDRELALAIEIQAAHQSAFDIDVMVDLRVSSEVETRYWDRQRWHEAIAFPAYHSTFDVESARYETLQYIRYRRSWQNAVEQDTERAYLRMLERIESAKRASVSPPLTVLQAKQLRIGQTLYHTTKRNADGTAMRARVTSVKTWKTRPNEVLIGVKHGLYDYAKFSESDIDQLTTVEPVYSKPAKRK